MSEVVRVSAADVERAQLVVKLNDYVGKPTSEAIRRIAAARPISPDRVNGRSANGHHRTA